MKMYRPLSLEILLVLAVLMACTAVPASAQSYKYIDDAGNIYFVDDINQIPYRYRNQILGDPTPTPVILDKQKKKAQKEKKKSEKKKKEKKLPKSLSERKREKEAQILAIPTATPWYKLPQPHQLPLQPNPQISNQNINQAPSDPSVSQQGHPENLEPLVTNRPVP